jgi:excinuclease ABC subunit B
MNQFDLHEPYKPAGDQPQAIDALVAGIHSGARHQTLLGATGTGKTYTIAHTIARVQKPTLVNFGVLVHFSFLYFQIF